MNTLHHLCSISGLNCDCDFIMESGVGLIPMLDLHGNCK